MLPPELDPPELEPPELEPPELDPPELELLELVVLELHPTGANATTITNAKTPLPSRIVDLRERGIARLGHGVHTIPDGPIIT